MRFVDGSDLKAALREAAARAGARGRASSRRSRARSTPPTRAGSSTATSSRRTCCSTSAGTSTSPTSASAGASATPARRARRRRSSLGTIDYVAPEQIRGEEVDGRADLYSLGCLLYECLTGEPPFRRGHRGGRPLRPPGGATPPALPGLEEVMRKALAKEPDERYQTCARAGRGRPRGARARRADAEPAGRSLLPRSGSR